MTTAKARRDASISILAGRGLATAPAWTVEGNQYDARLARVVARRGDVKATASRLHVGRLYDGRLANEGRVFGYYRRILRLSTTPDWIVDSEQAAAMGAAVAVPGRQRDGLRM